MNGLDHPFIFRNLEPFSLRVQLLRGEAWTEKEA